MSLKIVLVFKSLFPDLFHAEGTSSPVYLKCFISSEMYHPERKESDYFIEYVFQEEDSSIVSSTYEVSEYAGTPFNGILPGLTAVSDASEFRVRRKKSACMSRYLYLRNDLHAVLPGKSHHFPYLVLGIETGIVFRHRYPSEIRIASSGSDLSQFRILLYLYSPALIVREMPVKPVRPGCTGSFDHSLDVFYGHEMPYGIEHETAVGKRSFDHIATPLNKSLCYQFSYPVCKGVNIIKCNRAQSIKVL